MAEESKSKSGPAATPAGPAGGGGAAKPLTPEQVPRRAGRERAERRASGHVQSAPPSRRMRLPRATVPLLSPEHVQSATRPITRLLGGLPHFFYFFFIFTLYSLLIFCSCPSRSVTLGGLGFES